MGNKTSTNLTLHQKIRELAEELQDSLGYGSLSTLVEALIRDEYERRNGPMKLAERPPSVVAADNPITLAHATAEEHADKIVAENYGAKKLPGQAHSHRRRKTDSKRA